MLRSGQVARIKNLAGQGVSIRNISRATGLARETVRHVLLRKRARDAPASESGDAEIVGAAPNPREIVVADPELYDVQEPVFTGSPARCPTCGGMGYQPCLACRLRKLPRRKKQSGLPSCHWA